jgi:hypothetical protein
VATSPRTPDRFEKTVRLGCGGLLGLVFVGPLAYRFAGATAGMWVTIAAGTLLFAWLALRHGDRFWHAFADGFRALWPFWP